VTKAEEPAACELERPAVDRLGPALGPGEHRGRRRHQARGRDHRVGPEEIAQARRDRALAALGQELQEARGLGTTQAIEVAGGRGALGAGLGEHEPGRPHERSGRCLGGHGGGAAADAIGLSSP
jgi:hypothetical protein